MAQYRSNYTGQEIDAGIGKANTAVQPADLDDYQAKIDSSHKLSADLISDGETNKTVTETEKTTWNGKSVVSGTNDGTNWSTLTINGVTKNIPVGGGESSLSVKEIDHSNPEEWNSEEEQPTSEVIDDILENKYTFIHIYNIEIDEGTMVETYLISSGMIDVEETGTARYYYKFDEGDEDEGTSPNIEQYLFIHQEGESAQMLVENFELGGGAGTASWGSITGTLANQTDLQNALNSKQDGIIISVLDSDATKISKFEEALDTNGNIVKPIYLVSTSSDFYLSKGIFPLFHYSMENSNKDFAFVKVNELNIPYRGIQYTISNNTLTSQNIDLSEYTDYIGSIGDVHDLTTTAKNTLVAAVNEVNAKTGASGLKEVYVNASTGSDSNAGTSWATAKQTFASALAAAADECTLFFEGDTQERLNIKTNANQKVLRIVGRDGVRNRILGGTKLVDFQTTSTTGVYKIETPNTSAFSSNYYLIVQDNVIDTSTAISSYEAHPAQKGREYRLLSTPIPRKTSVANVISSTVGFYHDGTNLYVKPASSDFTNHPIYCPTTDGGIYGNDGSCLVEITNVEVWHSPMLITNCPNAIITDCSCSFALGTGGIKYDDSVNVILKRCEAAYTLNTSGYGDGINAHSSKYEALSGNTNNSKIKYVSAELIDCWCHDCSDDGWSDHSACEVIIRGGLYEYNHKGGVTPSSGGKCTCYDVMTRKNCRGFYYVSSNAYQKEKTAYFYCENCISDGEDATRVSQGITRLAGAGFSTDDVGVTVSGWKGIYSKFVNCKSMNNTIGFGAGKKSVINLIDCSTLNVTNITSLLDDGSITKYVTEPVSSAIAVTGVSINKTTQTTDYNQTFTLTATIAPSNATNKNVIWSIVSGSEYISINSSGLSCSVTTGSSNGSAVVRVTTEDGSYTAQCAITIEHKELVSLTATGALSKTSYFAGESLDTTGLTFTATFDDSSSTVLNANELSYNPDPLTVGTTSVDVSYTYGSVTKTVTVSGITVYVPLSVTWEQGAIQADVGNTNAANRIRTQGFIDLQETGSFSIKTLQEAKGCWWSYTSDATTQTRSTSSANAWVDYSEGFTINQTVVGARYVRFAIKKQDDANIVPSEADTYFEFIR